MAKIKKEFRCHYCGEQIEYGSVSAIIYDDHWYCDANCLVGDLDIETSPWADEYEYEYTEDETNGFGIKYIREDLYSNGRYIIFDKCPFGFDYEYEEYFGVRYGNAVPSLDHILASFEKHKYQMHPLGEFPRTVKRKICGSPNQRYFSEIFDGLWVNTDYWTFVIRQLSGSQFVKPSEISVASVSQDYVLVECNGKKATIAYNSEPSENPERFNEAEYYDEGLCGEDGLC